MITPSLEKKVNDFFALHRIAVAGVSREHSHHPVGNLIYRRMKKLGHEAFPVNPHMDTFEGDRCYPDLPSIPGGVEGVVIITRPEITEQIVKQCADNGVKHIWIHEGIDRKASSVYPQATEFCEQHGISVIAGACPMMFGVGADFGHRCIKWWLSVNNQLPS
jgi:predicted CoA-binding protein